MAKVKMLPCKEELKARIFYEEKNGIFGWLTGINAGQPIKLQLKNGYNYIPVRLAGKTKFIAAHRLAWFLSTGDDPYPYQIDHINLDRLDNSINNLRLCTQQQNNANKSAQKRKDGTRSPLKGVYKQLSTKTGEWTGRWYASISYNNKSKRLGTFDTPELAHMAYCKAAAELHGEFARGE